MVSNSDIRINRQNISFYLFIWSFLIEDKIILNSFLNSGFEKFSI